MLVFCKKLSNIPNLTSILRNTALPRLLTEESSSLHGITLNHFLYTRCTSLHTVLNKKSYNKKLKHRPLSSQPSKSNVLNQQNELNRLLDIAKPEVTSIAGDYMYLFKCISSVFDNNVIINAYIHI